LSQNCTIFHSWNIFYILILLQQTFCLLHTKPGKLSVCIISKVTDLISKRVPNRAYTNSSANYTETVCIVVMLDTCVWEMPGSNLDRLSGYPIVGFLWFSSLSKQISGLNYRRTAFSQILSNSSLTNHHSAVQFYTV
jgi:hypothetical protein